MWNMRVGNEGQRREGMLVLDPVKEVWAALLSLYLLPGGFSSGWGPAEDVLGHGMRPRSRAQG